MERHPAIGARMLEIYGAAEFIVAAVRHHHEAFDGRGYPDHLMGEAIPLAARILTVADVFDALTSERSYKAALTCAEACDRLRVGAGTFFDPVVVAAFLGVVDLWPEFVLARRSCPLTPAPTLRRNIWLDDTHDLIDL
jgi:HD-GYP domain-containing protein (c-di-GMP phosphodiesterase class II)